MKPKIVTVWYVIKKNIRDPAKFYPAPTEEAEKLALCFDGAALGEHRGAHGREGEPLQLLVAAALQQNVAHLLVQFKLFVHFDVVTAAEVDTFISKFKYNAGAGLDHWLHLPIRSV